MNAAVDLNALYENLEEMGVDVFSCPLSNMDALAEPDGYLGINPKRITSQAQERELLIHEEGHFATNTFYQMDSPYTVRRHQENVATRYGYKKYYSVEKLLNLMEDGCTEPWQLAEQLGVRQAYVEEMLAYYQEQGVDFPGCWPSAGASANSRKCWKRTRSPTPPAPGCRLWGFMKQTRSPNPRPKRFWTALRSA